MSSIPNEHERLHLRSHVFSPTGATDEASDVGARELLLAALGACTEAAVRRHAQARGWDLGDVAIEVAHVDDGGVSRIGRLIELDGPIDARQRAELVRVCAETPVTRVLAHRARISTVMVATSRDPHDALELVPG